MAYLLKGRDLLCSSVLYSPEGERLVATPIRFSGYYPSIERLRDREEHSRIRADHG